MIVPYLILLFGVVFMGLLGIAALCWAAKNGQFTNLNQSSRVIFDHDEPIGKPTDSFPEPRSRNAMQTFARASASAKAV